MNYTIESKSNELCKKVSNELKTKLNSLDFKENRNDLNYVFSLGGDGTLLKAISKYREKDPIFVGINLGKLGFLCSYNKYNYTDIFNEENNVIKEYSLLSISIDNRVYYALNEIRIESLFGKCLDLKIYVNGELFSFVKCDGICVSTSLGSTGINKSMGGSIIDTDIECIQLMEKLPVNNNKFSSLNSGLVLSKDKEIEIEILDKFAFSLCYDSSYLKEKSEGRIKIKLSNKKVRFLVNKNSNHLNKVKEAFL